VVNVWASWCVPCHDEAPLLLQLAKDNRLRVVGINYKDEADNARRFLGRYGNPFAAAGADQNGRAAIEWGVYGVPETFIVGRDAHIAYKLVGPITEDNLDSVLKPQIDKALADANDAIRLDPKYADAYTNIGLTEIQWEKYDSARGSILKALSLNRDGARALYYMALLERRASNYDAETADLKKVVELFPQSRDARRDLGISLYRQHDYPAAREQFEALQQIDPDDLAAHYNLSIIYRRMEMDQKAAEQQAQFITKKFDPGAPTYSFDFLRQHPEISIESIPQHVHTDLPYEAKPVAGAQ